MLWFRKGNCQAKVKHNTSKRKQERQIEIARGPNFKLIIKHKYMWTGVSRSSLARLFSRRLWRRSFWFSWDFVFPLVLDFVFVFVTLCLSSDCSGVSSLVRFCSRRIWTWSGLFLQPDDFYHDVCGVAVFARWSFVSQSSFAFFPRCF